MTSKVPEITQPALDPTRDSRMVDAIKAVEAILPGHAIALIVAPFGAAPGRRANYVGNGDRADIRAMMKEILARWEGRHQAAPGRPQ